MKCVFLGYVESDTFKAQISIPVPLSGGVCTTVGGGVLAVYQARLHT